MLKFQSSFSLRTVSINENSDRNFVIKTMQDIFILKFAGVISIFSLFPALILGATPAYGFQLDLSSATGNLTNGDSSGIGATMRFNDVATENGTTLDLVITTLDSYSPANSGNNGKINANDGQINIRNSSATTFKFSLVAADTNNPFTASEIDFGLFDIDSSANAQEKVILYSASNYTLPTTTALTKATFSDRLELTSPLGQPIDNPNNSTTLTQEQEKHAVSFRFNNASEFKIGYQVIGGGNTNGRNFFFAGDVVFDDTTPQITSFQTVPFEFSSSLGLLLSGGGLLGIKYLKKSRGAKISKLK